MSRTNFENGISYYAIVHQIENFLDRHMNLDSKQEQELNLRDMILYTIDYPEFMNCYDNMRETLLENIRTNYMPFGTDPTFLTACDDWIEMFGDADADDL